MRRGLVCLLCIAPPLAAEGEARADAAAVERAMARVVRQRYKALHGCYRLALAEDRSRGGTIFLKLTLGSRGSLAQVSIARDELGHKRAASCVVKLVKGWRLATVVAAGASGGSELLVPLTFRADPGRFVVRAGDAPKSAEGGGERRSLLNSKNVGAARAELALLTVRTRVDLRSAKEQAVYLLAGRGWLLGGGKRLKLRTGSAAWIPSGAPAVLVARGRRPVRSIQLLLPARSARGSLLVARASRARRRARGKMRRRALLNAGNLGHVRWNLGLLELRRRGRSEQHASRSASLLYVLSGSGKIHLGARSATIGPGSAAYLPPSRTRRLIATPRLRAVQIFVPAASEK